MAKYLTQSFHPVQIFWFRQLALLFGVIILLFRFGPSILNTSKPVLQCTRGLLAIMSGLLFIFAVNYVPLADAVAATFVAPFFLTILGAFVLKEKVGIRRWIAVLIGFCGAIVIVRPGLGIVHPAILLVVAAAAFYAARQITGRVLAKSDRTITTISYTAITASLVITLPLPWVWLWPQSPKHWIMFLVLSLLAGTGEVLVIKALEITEAVVVAPVHYTLIVWGTIYGFVIFNQLPDTWTVLGTLIIVCAGVYTLRRESAVKKQSQARKLSG